VGGGGPGPLADWLTTQHTQSSAAISRDTPPILADRNADPFVSGD